MNGVIVADGCSWRGVLRGLNGWHVTVTMLDGVTHQGEFSVIANREDAIHLHVTNDLGGLSAVQLDLPLDDIDTIEVS